MGDKYPLEQDVFPEGALHLLSEVAAMGKSNLNGFKVDEGSLGPRELAVEAEAALVGGEDGFVGAGRKGAANGV